MTFDSRSVLALSASAALFEWLAANDLTFAPHSLPIRYDAANGGRF